MQGSKIKVTYNLEKTACLPSGPAAVERNGQKMKKDTGVENALKGNSSDTLLVIYILRILKKYSSFEKPLSVHDVLEYLSYGYAIGCDENPDATRKKVRRHLDTLHECYGDGCVRKEEGKTRNGHKWYYDSSRDKFANESGSNRETLSDVELEFLVDLVSATKILNAESTQGMIDKLLKKTSLSVEEREQKLAAIKKERWTKTLNDDLVAKKEILQEYINDACGITFVYEGERVVSVVPLGWSYENGKCFLNAKAEDQNRRFSIEKIREPEIAEEAVNKADCGYYTESNPSNNTALDNLFCNLPLINNAIKEKRAIRFTYRSFVVDKKNIVLADEAKSILPHSLVFNDGKYYLLGIDEYAGGTNKIGYFRVDLIADLAYSEEKITLSSWNKQVFDTLQKAREVEKHPLMQVGREVEVIFSVLESALDRVIDAFGIDGVAFDAEKGTNDFREKFVNVTVMTTAEEAFRWALANADTVELISPQAVRDRLARIAEPIHRLYTKTLQDKVRENIDYVLKEGTFKISYMVDADTAYATYKKLAKMGKLGAVDNMGIAGEEICGGVDYFGDFINTKRLVLCAPQIKNMIWAAKLVNVETLDLTSSHVEDVSWMKEMKKLRKIYLSGSQVSDLSCLSEHEEIDEIEISGTNVSDISFIEDFSKLTQLHIAMCPIKDYLPLFSTKSRLRNLVIDRKALEKIGEKNIRNRHIGINIRTTNNSSFWYL